MKLSPHLTRRGFLISAALSASGFALPSDTPGCTLTSEQEEGPYYIEGALLRRDITEKRPGVTLILDVRLMDSRTCRPLTGAALDIWHCDALGVYSGFTAMSPDGGPPGGPRGFGPPPNAGGGFFPGMPPGPPMARKTDAKRFLRGVQLTNQQGVAEFATVYPGWYSGRATHIHLKVHTGDGHVAHTGQLFFPEDLTERIARLEPYAKRREVYRTTQGEDAIFQDEHGAECMLHMEKLARAEKDGFRATVTLAVDPEATPAPVNGFGRPPRRRS